MAVGGGGIGFVSHFWVGGWWRWGELGSFRIFWLATEPTEDPEDFVCRCLCGMGGHGLLLPLFSVLLPPPLKVGVNYWMHARSATLRAGSLACVLSDGYYTTEQVKSQRSKWKTVESPWAMLFL